MKNKSFKLTAIAASILAISACESDNDSSSSSAINSATKSSAFKTSAYPGLDSSNNIYGTWVMTSKSKGKGLVDATEDVSGNQVKQEVNSESAIAEIVTVTNSGNDSINVSTDCGSEGDTYYKIAENTYERGGYFPFEGSYVSDFNEDGSCADDDISCEKHTITFSADNTSADLSGEYQLENSGGAEIYNDEGYDYYSEGEHEFDADIFSDFGIENDDDIQVTFEESFDASSTGGMVKISDVTAVKFNDDSISYDGLSDKTNDTTTFDDTEAVTCFSYRAEGEKSSVTTKVDDDSNKVTEKKTMDNLMLEDNNGGDLEFYSETESDTGSGYSYVYKELQTDLTNHNGYYYYDRESIGGIEESSGDLFDIGKVKTSKGVFSISGMVESGDNSRKDLRAVSSGGSLLNINVEVDINAVEANNLILAK